MARTAKMLLKKVGFCLPKIQSMDAPYLLILLGWCNAFMNLMKLAELMPGKKDFVSIREGDHRVHVQKRLILGNLKEIYQQFKEKYPMVYRNLLSFVLEIVF